MQTATLARAISRAILGRLRPRSVVLPDDFVVALKDVYEAAMRGTPERFEQRAAAPALISPDRRFHLPPAGIYVMSSALGALHFRPLTEDELLTLVREAAASHPVGYMVDVDYMSRILTDTSMQRRITDPNAADDLDYIGRIMPSVVIVTATALKRDSRRRGPWRDWVDKSVRAYERTGYRSVVKAARRKAKARG